MKNIIRIPALCLAMLLSVSMLASCDLFGKSMDSIVEKIKDLDEDDYYYEKASSSDKEEFVEECEDEDIEFEKGIATMYFVESEDSYAMVIEFESSKDAKAYEKASKEYVADADEEELGVDPDNFVIQRSGNIVIVCDDKDLVDEIW